MIESKKTSDNLLSFVFILCFFFIFSFNLTGQSYFSDLDSMIYNGKISEAKNWLDSNQSSDSSKNHLINKYKIVLSWKDKVQSISDDTLKILLSPNMNQQQTFSQQKSGLLSSHYFNQSLILYKKQNFGESLFYSKLALFYKIIFLSESKEQVSTLLQNGFNIYKSIAKNETVELIRRIEDYQQIFSFSFNQTDSLSKLKNLNTEFWERQQTVDRSWNQKETWDYNWKVGLEGSLIFSKMLDNDNITVFLGAPENTFSDFKISTPEIRFIFSESLTLDKAIFEHLYAGCSFGYSRFSYSSDQTKGYKFKDFDITGFNYGLRLSYLLRKYVGVRPLIGVGFFVSDFERSESGIINDKIISPIWKSKAEKIFLANAKVYGGFEYLNDNTSNFSLSVLADFVQPLKKYGNYSSYNFSMTMGIGYIF